MLVDPTPAGDVATSGCAVHNCVFLGDDQTGRALEVVAVHLPDGLLVIHAQDLQAKFRPYYDKAREEE